MNVKVGANPTSLLTHILPHCSSMTSTTGPTRARCLPPPGLDLMLAITDAKGITYWTNEYDANGRETKQATSWHRRAATELDVENQCGRFELRPVMEGA